MVGSPGSPVTLCGPRSESLDLFAEHNGSRRASCNTLKSTIFECITVEQVYEVELTQRCGLYSLPQKSALYQGIA